MDNLYKLLEKIVNSNITKSVIIISLSIIIYRIIDHLIAKSLLKYTEKINKRKKTYLKLVTSVIRYIYIVIVILVLLQTNGVNVTSILAGLGIVGIVIGLAIQDVLKDIIRGFNILTDEYFQVGDVVLYEGVTGKVTSFGLNSTKIKDVATGNIVTIANRNIEKIQVVSNNIYINIPLPYELKKSDAKKVIDKIIKKISEEKNVDKATFKGINNFNDSNIAYLIEVCTSPELKLQVRRDCLGIIMEELEKSNIQIPFNQLDIHSK